MSKASAYFTVEDMHGKHDVKELKRGLDAIRGVISVSAGDQGLAVDFDTTGTGSEQIKKGIEKLGYVVSDMRLENHRM